MKTVSAFVLLIAVFVVSSSVAVAADVPDRERNIHIALTAPITGDYAEYGKHFRRSVEMGVELINARGGLLGKKLLLSVGDSEGDPEKSAELALKWISDPSIVAEIGDFTSTCCLASQSVYARAKMVQLSPTASDADFAKGSRWSFSIVGSQANEGPFMADYAYNILGLRSIAVIYIDNDWGYDTQKYFAHAFGQLGGKITAKEPYPEGEERFVEILSFLEDTRPEALFMAAMSKDGASISSMKKNIGFGGFLLGPSSLFSEQLLVLGGGAVEGLYTNASFLPDDPDPAVQAYVSGFESRFGLTPSFHAALAFDAVNLLAHAIEQAGTTDRTAIRDALAEVRDFDALTGAITFTRYGDAVKKYKRIWVKDGRFEVFK